MNSRGINPNNVKPEDWEVIAKDLLWRCYLAEGWKSPSLYFELEDGSIDMSAGFSAIHIPHKTLTWQDLLLKLGIHTDIITPDGHDCSICPENKGKVCNGFKNGVAHGPKCSWWSENMKKDED